MLATVLCSVCWQQFYVAYAFICPDLNYKNGDFLKFKLRVPQNIFLEKKKALHVSYKIVP
jgi:hypothetical protein